MGVISLLLLDFPEFRDSLLLSREDTLHPSWEGSGICDSNFVFTMLYSLLAENTYTFTEITA